ncbi:MAG: alpha-ketoacid dehydrogenase subunit beta [Rhodospirillaceae bacterium]|jgi:pyruvate dehydrogenase E1 component beta subunit|nr:alpha-ketoacid dehydrogenase subunit beta [Rhodospirillaceae bacterium]|tara:strand:- start:2379 stop:3437 length:1059 start_codon:yes stop_codon:yes gene_type:complete
MSSPTRTLSYAEALQEAVEQEMDQDEGVFVIGLNVDDHKAIQGTTRGLIDKFGPGRVIDTPLSEDAVTGIVIGAAMAGMRPIHVHIRMDFLLLCMNQLINMGAKAHYMYGGQVKVPLVMRSIIGKSWGQGAQHSQGLHAMFMHVPGLKVVAPTNAHDAKGCLIAAIRDNNPVVFVEHRLLYSTDAPVPEDPYTVDFGKARVVADGDDITLVGVSYMLVECLAARELLAEAGISATVIDPVSLLPLDVDTVARSAKQTGRLLVVDNAWVTCGAGAEIVAAVCERRDGASSLAVGRMGYAPTTCPTTPALEIGFYPNAVTIASKVHSMVRPGDPPWTPDAEPTLPHEAAFRGPF